MNFVGYWDLCREEKSNDWRKDPMEERPVGSRARQNLEPVFILSDQIAFCWRYHSRGRMESSSKLEVGQTLGKLSPKPLAFTWEQGDSETWKNLHHALVTASGLELRWPAPNTHHYMCLFICFLFFLCVVCLFCPGATHTDFQGLMSN